MDLLKERIKPLYGHYLVAASGGALAGSVFAVVDAMMVGQYHGPVGNAALAVFNPLWAVIFCLGLIAGVGGSILFASCRGEEEESKAQQYFTACLLFGAILSAFAMVVIGLFDQPLLRFFGADEELLVLAQKYLTPIYYAIPCCVFSNILAAFLRNDGNPALATKAVIIGGLFNVFGDYLCVFVLDMGIFGAGLATAIGQSLTALLMLLHFIGKKNTLRLVRPKGILQKIGSITVNGFSTGINDLAMGIISICFNRQIMTCLGTDALAVYGVIAQVTTFAQCLAYGVGQAAQPILSHNHGAGQRTRVKECMKYGLCTCALFGIFWVAMMALVPNLIVGLFMNPTPSVLTIAPKILGIYGISYLLLPFNVFATYYFQAIMKPKISLLLSLARGLVVSGVTILLFPRLFGADSIWYAMLATEILVALFGGYHMLRSIPKIQ